MIQNIYSKLKSASNPIILGDPDDGVIIDGREEAVQVCTLGSFSTNT